MNISYNRIKKPARRILSAATALVIASSVLPISDMWNGAKILTTNLIAYAEGEEEVSIITISTAKEFVEYSQFWDPDNDIYKTDGAFDSTKYEAGVTAHANDIIELAISSGATQGKFSNDENGDFCSIGTSAHPFIGTILINTGATGTLNLEKPLFDYLGDSARILLKPTSGVTIYPSTLDNQPSYEIAISRTDNNTGLPILANNVIHTLGEDETPKEWKVKLQQFSGSNNSYGGIIGTACSGSKTCISIDYDNTNSDIWTASGDVGRICCTMEINSELEVKSLSGSASTSVIAENGNSGGIVGTMNSGSKVKLSDAHSGIVSTITAGGSANYAGGIVGYCDNGSVEVSSSYNIDHIINGTAGSGGLYGYYSTNSSVELDTSGYSMNCTVKGSGNIGGLIGYLYNKNTSANITIKGSDTSSSRNYLTSSHSETNAANYGGLIGQYKSDSLSGTTLKIENISAETANSATSTYYGGAIGKIDGAAYVETDNFCLYNASDADSAVFGGAVGYAGDAFVVVKDLKASASDFTGGGVIGHLGNGVLQLVGTTDLSGAKPKTGDNNGQIVGYRDSALVFASLNDSSEWKLKRCSAVAVDDIGTWGEVIRFNSDFVQENVLSIADHTVTLGTPYATITDEETFAKFALNNQIRESTSVINVGSGANSLNTTSITISNNIDLSNTGLIGLTRDGSNNNKDYSGSISGSGKIKLAIGQAYGVRGDSETAATTAEAGSGQIYRHQYLGLVGETSGATTISGITLYGNINAVAQKDEAYFVGMAVGKVNSNLTVDGVTVGSSSYSANIDFNGNAKSDVGGLAGVFYANGETGNSIRKLYIGQTSACTFGANVSGSSANTGGVLGRIANTTYKNSEDKDVDTIGAFDAKIGSTSVSGSVTGTNKVGGLIASIAKSTDKANRNLILTTVSTSGLSVTNGGQLGDTWFDTEVQFGTTSSNGVTIGSSSSASTVAGSGDMAGLVNHATGQWIVNDIDITNLTVDSSSVSSFGVLVNKGYKTDDTESALFMWLKNGYDYDIDTITGSALDDASVFDEIVAYSASGDVTANGQGIVSIYTSGGALSMSGTKNTYTGQSTWGQEANIHTRYYYNLDDLVRSSYNATDNSSSLTAPKKLLAWSLQQYAHSSLRAYFAAPYSDNKIGAAAGTDSFDMTGLSYYPVNIDAKKSVALNGTVKLYNEEIENLVTTTTDKNRSTLNPTQHYLMHNGIFNDVVGSLTVGKLYLDGSVGILENGLNSTTGSGALVCGDIGGTSQNAMANFNMSSAGEIHLAGIKVHNKSAYSPLLINQIKKFSNCTVNGVQTDSGKYNNGTQVASSLIGYVGSTDATDISLTFNDIRLDARKTNSALKSTASSTAVATAATALADATTALEAVTEPGVGATEEEIAAYEALLSAKTDAQNAYDAAVLANTSASALDLAYHTNNSIFTNATLLEKLSYDPSYKGSVTGKYDYPSTKDWEAHTTGSGESAVTTYTHIAQVTYGAEISMGPLTAPILAPGSMNDEMEYKYSDDATYTNPLAYDGGKYTQFHTMFIPYVAQSYDNDDDKRQYQLRINHHSTSFSGCGTYNDPYILSEGVTGGDQLKTIATILNGGTDGSLYIGYSGSTWCSSTKNTSNPEKTPHRWYKWDGSVYKEYLWSDTGGDDGTGGYVATGKNDLNQNDMRSYLAQAYYQLEGSIEIVDDTTITTDDYTGLGTSTDTVGVFRGVIDGQKNRIVNNSDVPLITSSYGCVVKDVTVDVTRTVDIAMRQINTDTLSFATSSTSCKAYGAVIGKVFGGDNILDNVNVTYSFSDGKKISIDGNRAQLIPIGGFIGVVVNGGVYFRNMARTNTSGSTISYGLTNEEIKGRNGTSGNYETNLVDNTTKKWLYVNPIIGRVINGFAVTESDAYRPFENGSRSRIYVKENSSAADPSDTSGYSAIVTNSDYIKYNQCVTMQNGTKNYSITDISPDLDDLSFTNTSDETGSYNIKPKNAQSFFLMSCMVNSGMSYNNASSIGFYATNMMQRNLAAYDKIGTNVTSSSSCDDYNNYAQYDGTGTDKVGYLIKQYSDSDNAKSMANQSATTITLTKQDYILPDGYKGIGNFYQSSDYYRLKITQFNGNGASISQNTSFNYYHRAKDVSDVKTNVYDVSTDGTNGLGLFNYQNQAGTYEDFFLTGSVTAKLINSSNGNVYDYNLSNYGKMDGYKWILSVGMLMGCSAANQEINSVALENVDVLGGKYAGGLIGNIPASNTVIKNDSSYDSDNITVQSGVIAGGMIGRDQQGEIEVDYNNCTFNITKVSSLKATLGGDGNYYNYGVGGLIGVCRVRTIKKKDYVTGPVSISNIVIGNESTSATVSCANSDVYAGGMIGIINRGFLHMDNCKIYNLTVTSKFSSGGIVGQWATSAGAQEWTISDAVSNNAKSYISNTTIECTLTGTNRTAINSNNTDNNTKKFSVAGGFIGAGKEDMYDVIINNSSIKGYTISGTKYAGGIVGAWGDSSSTGGCVYDEHILEMKNVLASSCTIQSNTSDGYSGGLLGNLNWSNGNNHGNDNYNLLGYNIMAENLSFAGKNQGYICGYNTKTANNDIKLVGFSRQNNSSTTTMIEALIGSDDTSTGTFDSFGTNGYVIFADYNGSSLNPIKNTKGSYQKTTVTYDKDTDEAESSTSTVNVSYNTFSEDFKKSDTTNVTNQVKEYYRIEKVDTDTNKVVRNNKNELIYEVKDYSYGDNWPNVTTSPSYALNATYTAVSGKTGVTAQHFLTSDGVSSLRYAKNAAGGIPDSVPKLIIDDINSSKAWAYNNTGMAKDSTALTDLETALKVDGKYSDFKKEMGASANNIPNNFPVLVVDDIDASKTNTFVNNYLKLLTNSNMSFSSNKSGVFNVRTAKCTYSSGTGKFVPDYSTCNLRYTSGSGFSISNSYDNEEKDESGNKKLVFSLIDVEFLDPSDDSEVAYHLYVPVVVKKLLQYNFEATLRSGSTYKISEYTGARGNTLLENFENPVTLEFRYTYRRSLKDWRETIVSGENILFMFSKDVLFMSNSEDPIDHKKDSPGPMSMVLIDPNIYSDGTTPNKAYYAENSTAITNYGSNYKLTLSGFTDSGGTTSFTPKLLNDYFTITATEAESNNGNFTVASGATDSNGIPEDATVRAKCGTDTVYLKPSENNNGSYNISSSDIVYADGRNVENANLYEDYYVTFFTERPSTDDVHYYAVSAGSKGEYVEVAAAGEGVITARNGNSSILLRKLGENETSNSTYNIEMLYHYSFEPMSQLTAITPSGGNRSYPTQSVNAKEAHLYIGDLYENTIKVDTTHKEAKNSSDEITLAAPTIVVELNADVKLTSTASGIMNNTVKNNSAIDVFQSLLYTLNWTKTGETSQLGILSSNELDMKSYTVTGATINQDITSKYSMPDETTRNTYLDETNKNRVEMKNYVDIAADLATGVNIYSKFELTYTDKGAILAQFAEREDEEDPSGTNVIGFSNVSSSRNNTSTSAMSVSTSGTAKYYSTAENQASLQYDVVGKTNDDYGELGINANDLSEEEESSKKAKIETVAYYSLDSWNSTTEPKKIQLKFEMFDKAHNNYGTSQKISDYLDGFKVYTSKDSDITNSDSGCVVAFNEKSYVYTIDLTDSSYSNLLDYNEGLKSYTFFVDYFVYTGKNSDSTDKFESKARMYQNCKVKLTISLLDENDSVIPGSNPDNHVIYTNARIKTDVIDTNVS